MFTVRVALRLWFGPCISLSLCICTMQCKRCVCNAKRLSIVLFTDSLLFLPPIDSSTNTQFVCCCLFSSVNSSPRTDFALSRATSLTRRHRRRKYSLWFCLCISGSHHNETIINTHSKIILNRCFAAVFVATLPTLVTVSVVSNGTTHE